MCIRDRFKVAPPADDEDTIMKNFQHYCENRITEIERLEPKYENYAYPGKELLEKGKKRLSALANYILNILDITDSLYTNDTLDTIDIYPAAGICSAQDGRPVCYMVSSVLPFVCDFR